MALTTQNINQVPNDPELKDLLDYWKKALKLEFNCHHIGTIASFDGLKQTAEVTINYVKTFLQTDDTGNTSYTTQDYPVLVSCPVICLGGGTAYLTFPVTEGDECLVLFNDRDLDNWFAGSSSSAPATPRLHSFSDAVVLVGLRSLPNVIVNYDPDAAALQNGDYSLKIYTDQIVASNGSNVSIELNPNNIKALVGDDVVLDIEETFVTATVSANTNIKIEDQKLTATISANTTLIAQDGKVTVTAAASGTILEIDNAGKIKVTNPSGELIAALVQLFTDVQNGLVTTMLGPEPLVMPTFATDLTVLQSFKA